MVQAHHLNRMPSVGWDNLSAATTHPHIKPSLGNSILAVIPTRRRTYTKFYPFRFGERGEPLPARRSHNAQFNFGCKGVGI